MAAVALVVCGLSTVALAVVGIVLARRGGAAPAHAVPILASSAIGWGGAFLLAFAVSASAFRRDRASGIVHLFVTRTTSTRRYLVARIGGLAAVLATVTAGGTLVVGAAAVLAATGAEVALRAAHGTAAGFVFGLAFALVVAPVAFAALGARSRISGYGYLLALLVLPEIASSLLTGPLPGELTELFAIPSALAALRGAIAPGSVDGLRLLRALGALAAFSVIALAIVWRDVDLLDQEQGEA